MLRQLRLQNYRCFEDHTVLFNDSTVVVGKNNVGKSTLIEALRLLSLVINRRGGSLVPAPSWTSESPFRLCIAANISDLAFNRDRLFHRYGDPPAQITATFTEGGTVRLHIGREDKIFASIQTEDRWISTFSQFSALKLPPI
jgi:GTPase SAR1 family protein